MPKTTPLFFLIGVGIGALSCAGSKSASGGPAASSTAPDANAFSAYGLTINRPDGWTFIPPDGSMAPDTLIILQGPMGEEALAPAVEVSRRSLDARQQRRKPAHILTQMTTEIVQVFDGFEMLGAPEEIQVAGKPGAVIRMTFTESLPDGASVERGARFYGVVHRGGIWVIRCLGAADGSHDAAFDQILSGVTIES